MIGGGIKLLEQPNGEARAGVARAQGSQEATRGLGSALTESLVMTATILLVAGAQKKRMQSQVEAHAQETRLGVAVWQTEYLSFLLAALLETAGSFPEEDK
jgi:hypothetical protein